MHPFKAVALAAMAIVAVAACGGAAATPVGQPIGGTPSPAATGAAATPAGTTGASGAPATAATAAATGGAAVGLPSDLCSLLTAAEVSTVMGKKYEAGVPDAYGQCSWNVGKSSANSGDLIIVGSQAAELSLIKSTFPGGVDATVAGHAAYWNGKQGLGTMWVDLGGGKLFTLGFPRSVDLGETDRAAAQKLAELAFAKM